MPADSSRRTFLIAGTATAATVGVAAVAPSASASTGRAHRAAAPVTTPKDAAPLVVHIADPATGRATLLVGEREYEVADADLVGRIATAVARAETAGSTASVSGPEA